MKIIGSYVLVDIWHTMNVVQSSELSRKLRDVFGFSLSTNRTSHSYCSMTPFTLLCDLYALLLNFDARVFGWSYIHLVDIYWTIPISYKTYFCHFGDWGHYLITRPNERGSNGKIWYTFLVFFTFNFELWPLS